MNALQQQRTSQIKSLLKDISSHYKMTVQCAYKIGELLVEQKKELEHGQYLKWLSGNINVSERTAYNYEKLFTYKIASVANLQEAYKQIEDIETRKKQQEFAERNKQIDQFVKTGEKPEEWDRSTDYQFKKQQEDAEYIKRKQQAFEEKLTEKKRESDFVNDTIKEALDSLKKADELSLGDKENNFLQQNIFQAIDNYILAFNSPNEKIMAGQNIIKHVKEVINSNHVKMVS